MTAEIVSVGTELLMGQIADTNAQHLGSLLPELGIAHHYRQTVGDNQARLVASLRHALSRSDVVFTIGGLGPTQDDLTRDGIAEALGATLVRDEEIAEKLRKLFALRNLPWSESQLRQAMLPEGAVPIDNPNGSAPGLICEKDGKIVIALPGPKGEFVPMVDGPIRAFLAERSTGQIIHSRLLKVCALGESAVEDRIRPLMAGENPTLAPYAKPGEVHLRLTARAKSVDEADRMLDPLEAEVRDALGWTVFGADDQTLESVCLSRLAERTLTLATAESVTGGGVGARITDVPGASKVFRGGIVAYDVDAKANLLGVPRDLVAKFGPVSRECAGAMASGARSALGADVAIALTGNAGPTPDTDGKPVGLVYVALATPGQTYVEEHRFRSTRDVTRRRAGQVALTLLYRWLSSALDPA